MRQTLLQILNPAPELHSEAPDDQEIVVAFLIETGFLEFAEHLVAFEGSDEEVLAMADNYAYTTPGVVGDAILVKGSGTLRALW